jgi:hypothetical protein
LKKKKYNFWATKAGQKRLKKQQEKEKKQDKKNWAKMEKGSVRAEKAYQKQLAKNPIIYKNDEYGNQYYEENNVRFYSKIKYRFDEYGEYWIKDGKALYTRDEG